MLQPEGLEDIILSKHGAILHFEDAHELCDPALTLLHSDLRGAHEINDSSQQLKILLDCLRGSLVQVLAEVETCILFLRYFVVNNLKL